MHSRDAAVPNWRKPNLPDGNTLCGAIVSGPWEPPPANTDKFTDDRNKFQEAEAGIDYSGSVLCALGGWAAQPAGAYDHCTGSLNVGRTALTARV